MQVDIRVNRFLVASRLVFNGFFAVERPRDNPDRAWNQRDLFNLVQEALFQALVLHPLEIEGASYGSAPQPIRVRSNTGGNLPAMINREIDSGYWDFPLKECTGDADLRFIKFFDWSDIERRDNRYVVSKIVDWVSHPDLVGKLVLIESQYCTYEGLPELI